MGGDGVALVVLGAMGQGVIAGLLAVHEASRGRFGWAAALAGVALLCVFVAAVTPLVLRPPRRPARVRDQQEEVGT